MAKLVIEISEEKLSIIKNKMYCGVYDPDLYKAIANGTPLTDILDKIRAEIKGMYRVILKGTPKDDWAVRWNDCLDEVLEILDKYKAESEE